MFQWARDLISGRTSAVKLAEARNEHTRLQLLGKQTEAIQARYDNALWTEENRRNWWFADYLSAKSANNFQTRRMLRMRSRYEVSNNPYLWGICNNNADDLIGTGPTLKVMTPSPSYNREVETAWREWAHEISLTEKLRTQKLAKTVDGEGFLVLKTVEDLENPVKLFPVDIEADQVSTPAPTNMSELWVDGLSLHPVTGRPVAYHVMKHHPGDVYFPDMNPLKVQRIGKRYVLHWIPKFRPGQVRGVPVFTPSLDLFTELRAFRKATVGAAEIAADFAAVLQQSERMGAFAGDDTDRPYQAFKRVPLERKMATMLPPGATLNQLKAEHPATTYEMFQQLCLGEACRPLAYPLNLALGTSQRFNFSSSKLDIVNYRSSLTVERGDCDTITLKPLFREWFFEALLAGVVRAYDGTRPPPHVFHWPGYESLDPVVDANADHERLSHGTDTYRDFWARRGRDWKEVMAQQEAEKEEMARLGIVFGEPLKQSVSDTKTDTDKNDGNVEQAAKSRRRRGITSRLARRRQGLEAAHA